MGIKEADKIHKTVIPEKFCALDRIKFKTYRCYRPEFISPLPLSDQCAAVLKSEPLPKCWYWTTEEVADFVKEIGFPDVEETFTKNLINGKSLILLEADKLPKLNVKDFNKIRQLTAAFIGLYHIDQPEYKRSISLPLRHPRTLYLLHKGSRTGPTTSFMTSPAFYQKVKIIRDETAMDRQYSALLNHWNRIPPYQEWCPHVMIGNIRRVNPMTGTKQRQVYHPKDHPYLLKNLCIYSLPCEAEAHQILPCRKVRTTKKLFHSSPAINYHSL